MPSFTKAKKSKAAAGSATSAADSGPKFGGTESCVIIDLEDRYRTERPKLGYQQFRELWRR